MKKLLSEKAVRGSEGSICSVFHRKDFFFFSLERLHLLEFKAQQHQKGELTTHPTCTHCADTSQLHFRLNGILGPRTTLGSNTGSSQRGGGMVIDNPYFVFNC